MKEMENMHRNYDFYEFAYSDKVKNFIAEYLVKYRDEYNPTHSDKKSVIDMRAILTYSTLIEELKYYYNNDLCISVITGIAVLRHMDLDLKTHSYYLENAIFRISNMWEYIHIAINSILGMNLIVGKDIKKDLIEAGCYDVEFVEVGSGYCPVYHALPEIDAETTREQLEKEYILLQTSINKKKNKFHKEYHRRYSLNKSTQKIFYLFESNEVKEILSLRNEITHRRPLSAKFSMSPVDIFACQSININPKGWFNFKGIDILLEKNLAILREVLQTLVDICFHSDIPQSAANQNQSFYVYEIHCEICDKDLLIPDKSVEFLEANKLNIPCPYCHKTKTIIKEKTNIYDGYYFRTLKKYTDFLLENWHDIFGKNK